ncbi:fungal-specific transcription factor domain-containing protein [Aspergillus karnatakaensis]|uniref:transcription factor domain-containing protein n=1 Tax=Aspergillus karnatakaensis TaxID=1810916 RepID=UPI003CCC9CB7
MPRNNRTARLPALARARVSCSRCYRRKKKCDKALPTCNNCVSARVQCSFEDGDIETASYSIEYVQGLEERLRRLERAASGYEGSPQPTTPAAQNTAQPYDEPRMPEQAVLASMKESPVAFNDGGNFIHDAPLNSQVAPSPALTFDQQLTTLSLEATAERHLGSSTGLSFAKLTQMILRRLTPDKADFVFSSHQHHSPGANDSDLNFLSNPFNDGFYQSLRESISIHPLLFDYPYLGDFVEPNTALDSLAWPSDDRHVQQLVDFYFAHSHTLYPILQRSQVMETLDRIRHNPESLAVQPPLDVYRIWMVLAIGSTAYSSVTRSEESESMVFYSKAMQYSEQALGGDEMSALEAIMLQVSYSFFNQLGPNTWFLVGTAARLALGMGLHAASSYHKFPLDVQQRRKRIFFSIYMMDRVVSITLGRPFALHDDDLDVTPFEDITEDLIPPSHITPQPPLHPTPMSIPLHILSLRRIAGRISRQVYSASANSTTPLATREAIITALHSDLLTWRRTTPFPLPDIHPQVPHLTTAWYDFNFYTHLATLYRPSPLFPVSSIERIKILENAASMSLRQAYAMHKQDRFAYNWLNFLAVFTVTLELVYAVTAQPSDLAVVLRESRAIGDLEIAVQLFEGLGARFAAARRVGGMVGDVLDRYREILGGGDV